VLTVDDLLFALTLVAALGSGLIAGTFFAFSSFVMRALARLPSAEGITAMQSINLVVINPVFLGVFVGTAAACVIAIAATLARWNNPASIYVVIAGVLYLVGCFLVTIAFNVPRNNVLAKIQPDDTDAAKVWGDYIAGWTAWNHVRTVASLAAAASFILALRCHEVQR
jgi:uncharacterized membrane protein